MKYIITILFLFHNFLTAAQSQKVEAESFTAQNGLQVVSITDEGEKGQAVGYWNKGDFLLFTINAPREGIYLFTFRVGTNINDAVYELRDESENILSTIHPPYTGSHGNFTSITTMVKLRAGKQSVKYISTGDNVGADINWFRYAFDHEAGAPLVTLNEDTTIIITDNQPVNIRMNASARDDDGRIVSYQWKKLKGKATVAASSDASASINGLSLGENLFELTVTDNDKKVSVRKTRITVRKCSGKKILISPPDGDGSGISLQAEGYDKRAVYFPDPGYNPGWNFPRIMAGPGDTIALNSKYHWSFLDLFGIEGIAGCPVVITSDTGVVHIDRGIRLVDARYVKVTGRGKNEKLESYPTGSEKFRINIKGVDQVNGKKGFGHGGIAIEIIGRSAHVEVDMIRAERKGYGVQAKQDPTCDTMYNYPNWIMDDIHIHHCYFENILQDVLYLGNTDPLGTRQINCPSGVVFYKPMRLSNFNVHHNRILIANRTGIQLGGAETGYNQIHHNYVSDCGYEFNQQQGTGISIGGMSRNVHVFDNIIKRTFLYGIFDLGADSSFVYNNYVDSSGFLDISLLYPKMNVDSLGKALGVVKTSGRFILNKFQEGITNIQSTTKETFPRYSKTVFYMNNVLGANTSRSDEKGIISFSEWGPAIDWSENSVVCGNTRLNGEEVTIETFRHHSKKWPVISKDCDKSPLKLKKKQTKKPVSTKTKGISSKLIAGSAISLAVIGAIYLLYKKK